METGPYQPAGTPADDHRLEDLAGRVGQAAGQVPGPVDRTIASGTDATLLPRPDPSAAGDGGRSRADGRPLRHCQSWRLRRHGAPRESWGLTYQRYRSTRALLDPVRPNIYTRVRHEVEREAATVAVVPRTLKRVLPKVDEEPHDEAAEENEEEQLDADEDAQSIQEGQTAFSPPMPRSTALARCHRPIPVSFSDPGTSLDSPRNGESTAPGSAGSEATLQSAILPAGTRTPGHPSGA